MTQRSLFDRPAPAAPEPATPTRLESDGRQGSDAAATEADPRREQREELKRVRGDIGPTILSICRGWLQRGRPDFTMGELASVVEASLSGKDWRVAPDSTSRILRDLRKRGQLKYEVVSRSASAYRLLP